MIGDATVTFVGNVSQQPEMRHTQTGMAVCNFSVAVAGRRKNASGGYEVGPTSFYRVTCWRDLAGNVAESVNKGDRVVVTGTLAVREYEAEGVKGRSVEVEADDVGPSLRFATASVTRNPRNSTTPAPVGAGV